MQEVIFLILLISLFWFFFRSPKPLVEPRCPKCGGETEHYCGLGACVDRCPKCDRL